MKIKKNFGKFMLYTFGRIMSERGPLAKKLRNHWARMISKGVHKKANIHRGAFIGGDGNNLVLEEHSALGKNSVVGPDLFIGKHTMMGPDCIIFTQNHKFSIEEDKFVGYEYKHTYIGEYCWIGARVLIMAGAKIGSHCIIGAGSVVPAKEYPDYCLIAGNPAVVKKALR